MRSGGRKIFAATLLLAPLAACGSVDGGGESRPHPQLSQGLAEASGPEKASETPAQPAVPMSDERVIVGDPYMIDGQAYVPAAVASLDEVGYVAVLWETAEGRHTANGELYVPGAISAAHRTLPMPSYVEVTALETGRTILVRVNDRGPLLNDRVIALSPGAARQLGLSLLDGTAAVRVRKAMPTEQDRMALRSGRPVAERIETPPGLRTALIARLAPAPLPLTGPVRTLSIVPTLAVAMPAEPATPELTAAAPESTPPVQATPSEPIRKLVPVQHSRPTAAPARDIARPATRRGAYVVQIAALSSRARADALARQVGGYVMPAGSLFRVRTGPFASEAAARGSLGQLRAKGYAEARLMANDPR